MFKDTVIGFLNPQPKILIMDISRIVDAASIQFSQTPNADVNLALTKAAELSRAINEEASLLASKGYIVMSRQGVISSPTGVDITEQMALKMGVDLSKSKIKNGGTFGMAR